VARVLLVDDEATILIVLSALFRVAGHEVVSANGGDAALEIIKGQEFDLMISDVRMAPVDGMALLREAKKRYPKMSVIMITAFYSERAVEEARKMGAYAYLKKPFDNNELLRVAGEALEYARQVKEVAEE
jgi:DNA-binding NtrC family response regulator